MSGFDVPGGDGHPPARADRPTDLDPHFRVEVLGMLPDEVDRVLGAVEEPRYAWMDEVRRDMERNLTVHVVTIVCMRAPACRVMKQLHGYIVDTAISDFGVGFRFVCRLPQDGVRLVVDRGVVVELSREVVVVLLPDDALCGGATVTSRWTRPGV